MVTCTSGLQLPSLDSVPVAVAAAVREGRHGDKYVDRGCVNVVDVDKGP